MEFAEMDCEQIGPIEKQRGSGNTAPILARMKNAGVKNNAVQLMLPV